jgi:putative PIN family toxin of toxin-antitoxin system
VLRAVLDANVFASAYIRPEGPPGRILDRFFRESCFEIVLTPAIVDEVLRALRYPKVRKAARTQVESDLWFEDIIVLAELVTGGLVLPPLSSDPDDDKYVSAAVEGRASFVVTGDPDLLSLSAHQGVRIVTPRAFLELL